MVLASASFGMSLSKLNSASKEELMQINGIGEVKAAAIMKERRKGKFKSFEDLSSRVEGIGEQTAANIKNGVKVGETPKKVAKKSKKTVSKKKSAVKKETSKAKKKTESKKSKAAKKEISKKEKAKKAEKELKKNKKKVKKEKTKKSKKSKKAKKAA